MIEVKWKDAAPSVNFRRFLTAETVHRLQVVGELAQSKSFPNGLRIEPAQHFLASVHFGGEQSDPSAVGGGAVSPAAGGR